MNSKDALSLRHEEDSDLILFIFEDLNNQTRISNFELKLMDIDAEQLGIPDTDYSVTVKMPSAEFQRICRDLDAIGDAVTIDVSKDGVTFAVDGQIGSGKMCLKSRTITTSNKNKNKPAVKNEPNDDGMNMNMEDEDEDEEEDKENENDTGVNVDLDSSEQVLVQMQEPVSQQFALRYLNSFTKASNLSKTVTLQMAPEVPLMIEYQIDNIGYLRYYLAPKIDDDQ
jgi:proliferating cell nuclear antigen